MGKNMQDIVSKQRYSRKSFKQQQYVGKYRQYFFIATEMAGTTQFQVTPCLQLVLMDSLNH